MRAPKKSVLVPSTSLVSGIIVYLILSGILVQGLRPVSGVAEAIGSGSFSYVTRILYYETAEISYNMEDIYNSTHLQDFSSKEHLGAKSPSLQSDVGVYGQSLRWPSGVILCEDLDIIDTSFTIEAWIYPTSDDSIALAGAGIATLPYPHILKAQNGSMQFQHTGGGVAGALYSRQSVGLNAWTHVALVYDVSSGIVKWYLNASEQGSKFLGGGRRWDGEWSIGRISPDLSLAEWKGKIDEFRIYKGVALTQNKIEEDMKTSIARKLILTGLTPNSDVAQLWYQNGEFARTHMLQQTADANGQVEFNVYSFSGRSTPYNGILRVSHSGRTHSSPVLSFSWEDVYNFSLNIDFIETLLAVSISGLIIVVPTTLMIISHLMRKRRKTS